MKPTASHIRDLFNYDPNTGILTWKSNRSSNARAGMEAGSDQPSGRYVKIDRVLYRTSILIWVWVHGDWPKGFPHEIVEHIDRNQFNNRLTNLRLASIGENNFNKKPRFNSQTGYNGVNHSKTMGKYDARIRIKAKEIWLGTFDTLEEAVDARRVAELKYFGEFAPKE